MLIHNLTSNLLLQRLANQFYHLQDCIDRSIWLVNLDHVAAVFCKQLLAIRR